MTRLLRSAAFCGLVISCVSLAGPAGAAGVSAKDVLDATGVTGGLVVQVGCGDGQLTAGLAERPGMLVHALDADAEKVAAARRRLREAGLYGRASAEHWAADRLPHADGLARLVVSADLGSVPLAEVLRVLCPGGVAYVRGADGWAKTVKPRPAEIDEWTHYLHDATNNAVAADDRVGPPRHLQWVAPPKYCRSHEIDSSLSALVTAGGRMFAILDDGLIGITDPRLPQNWSLVARDAYSGVLLWKRPMDKWGWRQWKRNALEGKDWTGLRGQRLRLPGELARRLVAVGPGKGGAAGGSVFVTLSYRAAVTELDPATGEARRELAGTAGTDEIVCDGRRLALRVRGDLAGEDAKLEGDHVVVLDARTGERLWQHDARRIVPLTLAMVGERVVYFDGREVVCLTAGGGKELWRTAPAPKAKRVRRGGTTLVADESVVLLHRDGKVTGFDTRSGKKLWSAGIPGGPGIANPPDLFLAGGLVWAGKRPEGRDPRTGEVRRKLELRKTISPGHHFRCYRSKATENYLLWPKRGVEFLDVGGEGRHSRHDWLRGPCKYGLLPANGLLYCPPHQCFCYPGVKLSGMNAVAAAREDAPGEALPRHVRGPAYGSAVGAAKDAPGDWPTLRHDAARSGTAGCDVPADAAELWRAKLTGRISQPVAAGGRVYVAEIDAHRLRCLDAADGSGVWDHTAGGRIDSPPTVRDGLVVFGSHDGWVTCLRADDGRTVWRFRGGPRERRIVSYGQVASAWPVHGSVLVLPAPGGEGQLAYFAAGRSSYLDGGIHLHALDLATGRPRYHARLDGPHPDIREDEGRPFDMEGTLADVLVSDGEHLYMYQRVFDRKLAEVEAPRVTRMGDRRVGRHLFATAGLLDGTWWNRTFWMYSERWPGFYIANQAPKAGQILCFDDETTYGVKCYTRRNRHSPMHFPGTDGYLLFADDNDTEPALYDGKGEPKPIRWLPKLNPAIRHTLTMKAVDFDKGIGFTRTKPAKWQRAVGVRMRALVLAGETLFAAGPPDVLDENDPLAAFEGRKGARLLAFRAADGEKITERPLKALPVFDGLVAANGKLLLACTNGELICLGAK